MISASRFDALCLSLAGTTVAPHFDRKAYKTRKIFATLPADGQTANLLLDAVLQAAVLEAMPHVFTPVPGGWGRMGYTTVALRTATEAELVPVLREAHALASEPRTKTARKTASATTKPATETTAKAARPRTSKKTSTKAAKAASTRTSTKAAKAASTRTSTKRATSSSGRRG